MLLSELVPVVGELRSLVGAPLRGAWQPHRDRVILGLGDEHLLLVPRGPLARVHLIGRRPGNPQRPYSFQGAARAHLGGRLREIEGGLLDRTFSLRFERGALEVRLTGRGGGLWIVDEGRVVAAYDGPAAMLPPLPPPAPETIGRPPRFTPGHGQRWNDAAASWFEGEDHRREDLARRAALTRALRRHLDRLERLISALERDLDRAMAAPLLRRQADSLAARLFEIPRGASQAAVPDLEDPDHIHVIALNHRESAGRALGRLYERAGRLERQGLDVLDRLDLSKDRRVRLDEAIARVSTAAREELSALEALVPPSTSPGQAARRADIVTWRGPHGWQVWVGRSAAANRALTFQRARGRDWWMHLRDRPGAHLILPVRSGGGPALEWLLAAAQIALIHGGVAVGAAADVQYTAVRHVRAIPGDALGRVQVHEERVLHVAREQVPPVGWLRDA